jgi:2-phosphosulfolactate phosphatase
MEWGPIGAATLAETCDVLVVVDVLSFTTCVSIACGRGVTVWPHRWVDDSAAMRARDLNAVVAGPRGSAVSLSPVSLLALPVGARLVLPSPNGSTIAAAADRSGRTVVAACLRNAGAVACWLAANGGTVGVVPAGERWPDGSLRPAYEDLVGAGSVAIRLGLPLGRDAEAAAAAYERWSVGRLLDCRSGRELVARGFRDDVLVAAEEEADHAIPVLRDGAFVDALREGP